MATVKKRSALQALPQVPRNPDGFIDNCALHNGLEEGEEGCQICKGKCPDKGRLTGEDDGILAPGDGETVAIQETSVPQDVPTGDTKRGTIMVRSQIDKLDPTIKATDIEVEVFVTQPVIISRMFEGVLLGTDGYPRGKTSCFISWPCYREEFQQTLEAVTKRAKDEVRRELMEAKAKIDRGKKIRPM